MAQDDHRTWVYVGFAGEGANIGTGGLYRKADGGAEWEPITNGLPPEPQVRALLVHPEHPEVVYAGTHKGVYRSSDRGDHWEALEAPRDGMDVWSLLFHPNDNNVIYAGYEPCAISKSEDGGDTWRRMNTDSVTFPHVTTYPPSPLGKRVISMTVDPLNPQDMYASIEVGGLLASRDGGESWEQILDGPYTRHNTLDVHCVKVSSAAPGSVYLATDIAMFRSRQRGSYWEHIQIDEVTPEGSYCRDLKVAPDDPRTLYLAAGSLGGFAQAGQAEEGVLFRSRDVGETWDRVDLGQDAPGRMFQVAIDAAVPSNIYCCTYHGQVYSSHDNGTTWAMSQIPEETSRSTHVYPMACG